MSIDITELSKIVETQFPGFVKSDYPKFISFLESYYSWMEQEGNPSWVSKNIVKNIDIDETLDKFVGHFKNELAEVFPEYNRIQDAEEVFENYFGLINESDGSPVSTGVSDIEDQDEWAGDNATSMFTLSHHPLDKDTLEIVVTIDGEVIPQDGENKGCHINSENVPATLQFITPGTTTPYAPAFDTNIKVFYRISGFSVDAQSIVSQRTSPEEKSEVEKKHYDNKILLLKKIKDFYLAKGSEKSFDFLFRVLFNTDVSLQYPKEYLLKPSTGRWTVETTIRTKSDEQKEDNLDIIKIIGNDTNSSATIEYYEKMIIGNEYITEYYLSSVEGDFNDSSYTLIIDGGEKFYESAADSIIGFNIQDSGHSYLEGFPLNIQGMGDQAQAYIKSVSRGSVSEVNVAGAGEWEEIDFYTQDYAVPIHDVSVSNPNFVIPESALVFNIDEYFCRTKRPFEVHIDMTDAEGDVYVNISVDLRQRVYDFIKLNAENGVYDINGDGHFTLHDVEMIRRWMRGERGIDLVSDIIDELLDENDIGYATSLFPPGSSRIDILDIEKHLLSMENQMFFDVNFDKQFIEGVDDFLMDYYIEHSPVNFNDDVALPESLFPDDSKTHRLGLPYTDFNGERHDFMFELDPYGSYTHILKVWSSPIRETSDGINIIEHSSRWILTENNEKLILGETYDSEPLITEPYAIQDGAVIHRFYIRRKSWGHCGRDYVTGEKLVFDNSITGGSGCVARIEEVDNVGGIVKCNVVNQGNGYKRAPFVSVEPETEAGNVSQGVGGYLTARGTFGSIRKIAIKNFGAGYGSNVRINLKGPEEHDEDVSGVPYNPYMLEKMGDGDAILEPIIGSFCQYEGKYINTDGFLSDKNVLQDNYYYQDYSYVIRVDRQIDEWREIVKKIVHPAGLEFFGEFVTSGYAKRSKDRTADFEIWIEIIKNLTLTTKLMDGLGQVTGNSSQYVKLVSLNKHIPRTMDNDTEEFVFDVPADTRASINIITSNKPDLTDTARVDIKVDSSTIAVLGDEDYPLIQNDKDKTSHSFEFDLTAGEHSISLQTLTSDLVKLENLSVYMHNEECAIDKQNTTIVNEKRGGVNYLANWHLGNISEGANPRSDKHIIYIHKRIHQIPSLGTVGRSLERNKFRWRNTFRFSELRDRYSPQRFEPIPKLFAPYGNTQIDDHDFENLSVEDLEKNYDRNDEAMIDAHYSVYPKRLWVTEFEVRPLGTDTLGPRRLSLERYKLNTEQTVEVDDFYLKDISVGEEEDTYNHKINVGITPSHNPRPVIKTVTQTTTWIGTTRDIVGPQWRSLERDKWGHGVDDVDGSEFSIADLEMNYKYKKNIAIPPVVTVTRK